MYVMYVCMYVCNVFKVMEGMYIIFVCMYVIFVFNNPISSEKKFLPFVFNSFLNSM